MKRNKERKIIKRKNKDMQKKEMKMTILRNIIQKLYIYIYREREGGGRGREIVMEKYRQTT